MELPQSRLFGTEGKKPIHDFLSLYNNNSSFHPQDPRSSPGMYLKTRDFLQPLETVEKSSSNSNGERTINIETPTFGSSAGPALPPQAPPRLPSSATLSTGQALPGGFGTYTISHISEFNQYLIPPKPEASLDKKGEVKKGTSNSSSSYNGSSLSLWGESVVETGTTTSTTKKSCSIEERQVLRGPEQKCSSEQPMRSRNSSFMSNFSSLSRSEESSQKNQSFMEMMKSGKGLQDEDDYEEEEFSFKKEGFPQKQLMVKVEGKSNDQKANTPRSKHSATEQRRRSKINDRFQILRDILPLDDQKRDKASFLLEVIGYIQFLQEKVNKYESSYQGFNPETTKSMPWRNKYEHGESQDKHSQSTKNLSSPGLMFSRKFIDQNISIGSQMVVNDKRTGDPPYNPDLGVLNKAILFPIPKQPDTTIISSVRNSDPAQPPERLTCDGENVASKTELHLWQNQPSITTRGPLNEQDEREIEGRKVSISHIYSQGLLNNLTKTLERSGIDLSNTSISVQLDVGRKSCSKMTSTADHENLSSRAMVRARGGSIEEDYDHQAQKKLKTEKS